MLSLVFHILKVYYVGVNAQEILNRQTAEETLQMISNDVDMD